MRFSAVGPIITLALGLIAVPLTAHAQQAAKVPRVGFLASGSPSSFSSYLEGVRQGLRALGHTEGQNIAVEQRYAYGVHDRLPGLAVELVQLNVDVIVAGTTEAAVAARQKTGAIPIVVVEGWDLVGAGLAATRSRPGGNVTGMSALDSVQFAGDRLELLKAAIPGVTRTAVLWDPNSLLSTLILAGILEEGKLGVGVPAGEVHPIAVADPSDFDTAFTAMTHEHVGALLLLASPMFDAHRERIMKLAATHRLPVMGYSRKYIEAGALMIYGPSLPDLCLRASYYIDRILKGTKPSGLPLEEPTKFELVINLETAKALGLTIPQSVLIRADQVIE